MRRRLDQADRAIVERLSHDARVSNREIAEQLGVDAGDVMQRMQRMLDMGIIRRIGAVPNHYAIGYTANGMSVWNVDDERIDELGVRVGWGLTEDAPNFFSNVGVGWRF